MAKSLSDIPSKEEALTPFPFAVADLIDSFVEALQSHVPPTLRKLQNIFTAPVGSRRKETTNMEP